MECRFVVTSCLLNGGAEMLAVGTEGVVFVEGGGGDVVSWYVYLREEEREGLSCDRRSCLRGGIMGGDGISGWEIQLEKSIGIFSMRCARDARCEGR